MALSVETPTEVLDPQRLASLGLTGLMDTPPEQAFDRFTALAQQILGVPVVLVSLVSEDRQFFKSQQGLPEPWATRRETPLSHSFCQQVVINQAPFVVEDATKHPAVKDNLAISEIGVMAYAGVPIKTSDQKIIGSFCAIDTQPRHWNERELEVLEALAEVVMREVVLRELTQKLNAQYQALQKAEQERDGLVHMVVHDLRTPLTSLLMGLQTLDSAVELEAFPREVLNIALVGAKSLAEMVNTILDVSRAEAGALVLECEPLVPLAVVERAITQVRQLINQRSLNLIVDLPDDLPFVVADENKIARVLVNLLGNAIRHTPARGEIRVSIQHRHDKQELLCCVSDNGFGIASENLERIFDKYAQVGNEGREQATSGLGLTFCRLVIEAHKGEIWAESELRQGSQFYFTLPLHEKHTA